MEVKIVYDNESMSGFRSGWGFSCLLELDDEIILFDTGWDGEMLLGNMSNFGVGPSDIDRMVLSHAHWDHTGGVPHVQGEDIDVYVPSSFSEHLKQDMSSRYNLHEIGGPAKIRDGVWTTGELENRIEEQSLVLETRKGLLAVAGCSHPGVRKILSAASKFGDLWGIVGGLHGFDDYEVLEELDFVMATHCTKHKDEIKELYPDKYVEGKAGLELTLE